MEPKDLSYYIAEISKHYTYPKTPAAMSSLEDQLLRFLRSLFDFLNSLNIKIPYPNHENLVTMAMMLAVFVIAFIAISIMVIVLIKNAKDSTIKVASRRALDADLEPLLDSSSWLAVAGELALEKNFRSACRAVFLSSLLTLDERSLAAFTPSLSNYEYLHRLARFKNIQAPVKNLANKVDLIWFGNKQAESNDYQDCLSLNNEIKRQAEIAIRARQANGQ